MENINQNHKKELIALSGLVLIVLGNIGMTLHEALYERPRQMTEYKQRVESKGETFDINKFYASTRRMHYHRR